MNRDELYGSARWAEAEEIAAAGLHDPKGLYFGQSAGGKPLRLPFDMPLITFGGAGSGKGRDIILHNVLTHPGHMFITDPKGELAAVATQGQGTRGKAAYCINPYCTQGRPGACLPTPSIRSMY